VIIAVDGPAAAGKGTLAKRLADHYSLPYMDTGLLYRAVGVRALATGRDPVTVARGLQAADLDNPALRGETAGRAASQVATIAAVRAALLDLQRVFARQPGGAVLDGRDIGTVVCPDADIKLFVTASAEKRAERRWKELLAKGETAIAERVLQDLRERDARDAARAVAPLIPATDAVLLDTSGLDADAAFAAALAMIARKRTADS
jgi:cytidylate kinase